MRALIAVLGLLCGWAMFAYAVPALGAGPGSTLELSVIHATRGDAGGSIDPRLRDLPQLARDEPFVRYDVFRLLDRKRLPLELGKAVEYPLPNGRTFRIQLEGVSSDAGEPRYRVTAQITEPGKKAFLRSLALTSSENEAFFVGGQIFQGGTLFIELVIRPGSPSP